MLRRASFGLIRDLPGRIPWDWDGQERGSRQLVNIQASLPWSIPMSKKASKGTPAWISRKVLAKLSQKKEVYST